MCGIIGANENNNHFLERALATFNYRGPDYIGFFANNKVIFGHNRLSIIDLDSRSNQPMVDYEKEVVIVFNGEIYNFRELKKILSRDYKFATTSDTEVLLYAYKKYGVELTKHIKGMYAFAVYDKRVEKMFLFR